MHILRKVGLGILSPLFIFLLFTTAFDIGFVRTATHSATVKKLVADSGVYNTVVPQLLNNAGSFKVGGVMVPANDPIIKNAAEKGLPPQYIRQTVEGGVIEPVYKWLDGKSSEPQKPDIYVDLNLAAGKFSKIVTTDLYNQVYSHLKDLPTCSRTEALKLANIYATGEVLDWRNVTCTYPTGVTASNLAAYVSSNTDTSPLLSQIGKVSPITADSFKSSDGRSIFETQLKTAPKQYQRAKKTPLILSVLTILTGAGIVFLSISWQKGLRHIGINLVIIGLIMLLFSWGLNRAVSTEVVPKITLDNAVLQQDIRNLVTDLVQQIDKNYWFFGGLYSVLGASGIAAGQFIRRGKGPGTPGSRESGYQPPARHQAAQSVVPPKSKAD
jgi:hypothetical protein